MNKKMFNLKSKTDHELMQLADTVINDKEMFDEILKELNSRGIYHSIKQARQTMTATKMTYKDINKNLDE
jgi:glutamate-1-semialdehyde aminotransferase